MNVWGLCIITPVILIDLVAIGTHLYEKGGPIHPTSLCISET